jgi:hypothetical protein
LVHLKIGSRSASAMAATSTATQMIQHRRQHRDQTDQRPRLALVHRHWLPVFSPTPTMCVTIGGTGAAADSPANDLPP